MKKPPTKNKFFMTVMRCSLFQLIMIFMFAGLSSAKDGTAQKMLEKKITIRAENVSIKNILSQLSAIAQVNFMYSPVAIHADRTATLVLEDRPLSEALDNFLPPLNIRYRVSKSKIILSYEENSIASNETIGMGPHADSKGIKNMEAEDRLIRGNITDDKGAPLSGVSVTLKGKGTGTSSNDKGDFSLMVPDNAVLLFSLVGFEELELPVGDQTSLSVSMKNTKASMNEVVVVGYGTQARRNVTGSVSKLDMKQVEGLPNTNVSQAIRGRVAGVQFTENGRPGQGGSIVIRGARSITASNDPLIVLDGIIFNGNLADINPNDIESMEVLKDASSGAIYGARAANGVILINSKKGTAAKPTIRFNMFAGVTDWSRQIKLLTPDRYIQKTLDVRKQTGQTADPAQIATYLTNTEAENYRNGITVDPWDEVSQNGSIQSYDLSVSGRMGKTNYFISGAQVYEKGLILNDNASRTSFRINLETSITNWLRFGVNSQFSVRDLSGREADTQQGYTLSPFGKVYYDSAKQDPVPYPVDDQIQRSPVFNAILDKDDEKKYNLFANLYTIVDFPFIKGLSYRLNLSPNYRWEHRYTSSPIYRRNGLNNLGSASKYNREDFDWMIENILNYSKKFGYDHDLDVTLLYGSMRRQWESTNANASNFFTDVLGWNNLNLGQVQQTFSDAQQVDGISSMIRLNYRYKGRYLFTFTTRRDGSSVFGANHKYGVFPSAAFAWVISDEKFLDNSKIVNFLKLRVSYGSVGNQAIGPYQSLGRSSTTQYVFGDGGTTSNGVFTSSMANPNLRWETTVSQNAAVDFELFKNRIGGTLEFYNMRTKDLLLNRSLPSPTGFSQVLSNLGETKNTGVEFTLNTVNILQRKFEWSTGFVFSHNKNQIVHLYGSDINNDGKEDDDLGNRWFIGKPISINYDYVLDGIYQERDILPAGSKAGDIRFKDLNGDGKIDANDRTVISQREPKYRWGINNTLKYGNFTFSFFINAMTGWSQSFYLLDPVNNFPARPVNMLDVGWWTAENKSNTRPSLVYTNPLGYGYYTSRDFIRIQDILLAYDFPKATISKWKMSGLRVFASAKNVKTFTDYVGQDPESGYNFAGYPTPRTWAIGINVSF